MLIETLSGSLFADETYIFPIRNNSERASFESLQIRSWKSESAEGYFSEKTAFFSNKASRCGILAHLPFAPTRARVAAHPSVRTRTLFARTSPPVPHAAWPAARPLRRRPLRACVQVVSPAQAGNSSLKPAFPAAIMLLCVCVCMDTPGRVVRRSRGAEPPSALKRQSSDLEERKRFLVCGEAREQESRGAISGAEASQPRKRGRPAWKER